MSRKPRRAPVTEPALKLTPAQVKARMEALWQEPGVRSSRTKARWAGPGHETGGALLKTKDDK